MGHLQWSFWPHMSNMIRLAQQWAARSCPCSKRAQGEFCSVSSSQWGCWARSGEDALEDFSSQSSVLLLMSLLIAAGQVVMERVRIKDLCSREKEFSLCKLFMHWPRTVRFSSWLQWRMWRCHSYLWRCQKILGSWGPKCQAHLNGSWVENTKISTKINTPERC